jgi:hypothetical protein
LSFVPIKIVLKVGFLGLDFEHDHLAEKTYRTKMGHKLHCELSKKIEIIFNESDKVLL